MRILMIALSLAPAVAAADDWKPAPQMAQLSNLLGTWQCDGYDAGKVAWHAKTVNKLDFGGAWMSVRFDAEAKAGEAPDGTHGSMGWDPDKKQFVFVASHGDGGWHVSVSTGRDKDRLVWTRVMPTAEPDKHSVFVFKDKTHVELHLEEGTGKALKSTLIEKCTLGPDDPDPAEILRRQQEQLRKEQKKLKTDLK
jgi:hypothetical protein